MSGIVKNLGETVLGGILAVNRVYQEGFAGTEGSDLIYPVAKEVMKLGNSIFSHSKWERTANATIALGTLLIGASMGKKSPLLLAELSLGLAERHLFLWMLNNNGKEDKKYFVSRCFNIGTIALLIIKVSLIRYRNPHLSLKPYVFSFIVQYVVATLTFERVHDQMKKVVGNGMCANGKTPYSVLTTHAFITFVFFPLVAKCATLVTGESMKMNWKVQQMSVIAAFTARAFL